MARVGRLAGAILAETGGDDYLVGNPKQPCDWRAAGFEPPVEIDARVRPVVRLARCGPPVHEDRPGDAPALPAVVRESPELTAPGLAMPLPRRPVLAPPVLELDVEGEALGRLLADLFVIARTGSVSERLWRLVIGQPDESDETSPPPGAIAARWLGEMPPAIWQIVRDAVLRCT